MQFLNHGNTIMEWHLNASKLHINKKCTQVLSNGFAKAISNIINRQFVLHSLDSDNKNNRNTNDYDENNAKLRVGIISASNLEAIRKKKRK